MSEEAGIEQSRGVSGPLMLGIIVIPIVFVWFLLRRGYATQTRIAAFVYTAVNLGFGILSGALR